MSSIRTAIELYDAFSTPMMSIVNAVSLGMSAITELQSTMNESVSFDVADTAREQMNQVTAAIEEARAKLAEPVTHENTSLTWDSPTMDTFTTSGIERFQQELQSANSIMESLNTTQMKIATQAQRTEIFPQNMISDMTDMQSHIQAIQQKIQQLENNPMNMGVTGANNELERLRSQLSQALGEQNQLNTAMNNMDVGSANEAYMRLSQTIATTERYIRDNTDEQGRFNQAVQNCYSQTMKVSDGFAGWQRAIIVANQAMGLIKSTLSSIGVMDMSGAFNRLDTMNRFEKTITIMTGDAHLANAALSQLRETTLGTAYGLDVAAKSTQGFMTRGMSLGAATNQVRVWADAVSFYGEGTNAQLESVVDAIGKMYSKGKVEADQLDRLFDAGIGAAEIYANAVGESVSAVKEDLSAGTISAYKFIDVVSQAMDSGISAGAAKDAGSTWATTFANMHAVITRGWTSIITGLDAALASHGLPSSMEMVSSFGNKMESVLNSVGNAMNFLVDVTMNVYDIMSTVSGFIADNWSIIEPLIIGVVTAMSLYTAALIANNIVQGISNVQKAFAAVAEYKNAKAILANSAAYTAETVATASATVAQASFNTALAACPITWIIVGIIAIIAIFYAAVAAVNHFAGTSVSATGLIAGVIALAGAAIWNTILGVINFIIGIGVELYNLIATFANFFANVFNDPVGAILNLFSGMFDFILGIVQDAAKLIDTILGTDMASAVEGFRNDFADAVNDIIGDQTVVMEKLDASDYQFDGIDYGDAWDAGYSFGEGIDEKISNFELSDIFGKNDISNPDIDASNMATDISGIAGDTKDVKDSLDISQEDLKYMRDMAERDAVNRYTTAEIKVDMTNNNTVSSSMDLDGMIHELAVGVNEAMDKAAERG
ncbi:hypothetical protein acsn021_04110 [Anaerocolumna cellulosilytica]|uniref:Uncharacterized protein n=1 Tax=Anaerocolumna cellulosilytica TaxID=433286 RepID=A0A6S6QZX0_9FIRM|nr:tape measure protein [Anaerocolumna cellulosilytica]MBB5197399.1 tape measure domain-containing protein [Anaerocolumna cellulosilytica]BCJ92842.1 hypothetical protein acsn021_04110 [Anaerocolumna cellulosilytica]